MSRAGVVRAIFLVCVFASCAVGAARGNAQEATYTFEEELIRGMIDKPEAFYILSPSSLDYAALDAEESFLDVLWDTVEEPSF